MHINFTLSTLPMLLLAAYLWYRAKWQFLPVAIFMSVFGAASVANISFGALQIGVQPTYLVLLIALVTRFAGRRPSRNRAWQPLASTTLLLALLVTYASASAFISPFLFEGVLITNPKLGFGVPLNWELGHLNQLFYLLLSFAIYLVAAYWTPPAELTKSLNWFVGGVVLASLIGIYQFLAMKTGLPFPSEFLHTSPTYATFEGYEINGFPRMNSTFVEASSAAFSMTVALALALWRFLSEAASLRNIIYVSLIAIGLLITISTTGYICLIYLLFAAALRYFLLRKGSCDSRTARVLLAIPIILALAALLGVPDVRASFARLAHTVILDKTQTESYATRTQEDEDALKTAAGTQWLGAGWGVCRASGFIPTILGNVGIPGSILFFTFCLRLLWPAVRLKRNKILIHGAVLFAISAALLDLLISGPEIAHPIIWLLFAVAAKLAGRRSAVRFRHSTAMEAPNLQDDGVLVGSI